MFSDKYEVVHSNESYKDKIAKNKDIGKILGKYVCSGSKIGKIHSIDDIPSKFKFIGVLDKDELKNSKIIFAQDTIHDIYFIIKEAKDKDKDMAKKIYSKLNKILLSGLNDNFISTFCIVHLEDRNVYFQEYFTYTFHELLKNHKGFSTYKKVTTFSDMFKRIIISIGNLLENGIIHSDLHLRNILITRSNNFSTTEYTLDGRKYSVPIGGFEIAITDFNNGFFETEKENIESFCKRFFGYEYLKYRNTYSESIIHLADLYVFINSLRSTLASVMSNSIKEVFNAINIHSESIRELIHDTLSGKNVGKKIVYNLIWDIIDLIDYELSVKSILYTHID